MELFYSLHPWAAPAMFAAAVITIISVLKITAPYGRHTREGFGPAVPQRLAWIVMESPSVWAFGLFFYLGPRSTEPAHIVFLGIWWLHYVQRVAVYGSLMRVRPGATTPLLIMSMAIAFNLLNSFTNGLGVGGLGRSYDLQWFTDLRFIAGLGLFLAGWSTNIWADRVLRKLRKDNPDSYSIPRGGLYELVSCPNYFAEIVEWFGWALLTWSWEGLAFATYTLANLLPRALAHHRWYNKEFPDYPDGRKALIPGLL